MFLNISKFGTICRKNFFSSKFSTFYTKNHEWIKITENESQSSDQKNILRAKIGITEYSQKALGDIVFIDMPKIDSMYNAEGKNS